MSERGALKLPHQVLLAGSVLVPLLLYVGISWHLYYEHLNAGARNVRQTVMLLDEHAQRVFESQRLIIERVDDYLADRSWEDIRASEEVHAFLRTLALKTPHVDGLWLIPPDGRTANSADFFPFPEVDVTGRDYFQALQAADTTYFGQMIVGKLKGNLNFNLSSRRSPSDRFNGLILVTASLSYFTDYWGQATGYERPAMTLLRPDGEILARYPPIANLPKSLPADTLTRLGTDEGGFYSGPSISDGMERLIGWSRIGDLPLYIAFGVEVDEVLAPWRASLLSHALVAVSASILLGGTAAMAANRGRRLSTALGSWQETAARLRKEVDRRVRAEDVAGEKDRLLQNLQAATDERNAILESMAEGVVAYDADGQAVYWNSASRRILGLTGERPPDLCQLAGDGNLRNLDDQPLPLERTPLRRALSGEVMTAEDLRVHLPRDGSPLICRFLGAPLKRHDGTIYGAVLSFGDITTERLAEDRRALLMAELDHRVRNMLATIAAMVRISSSHAVSQEDLVETLTGRIGAMARTHGLLTQSGWSGADLRQIVSDELTPFATADRIRLSGPEGISLPPKDALDFALIVHELATNAAKHGALSCATGRVAVSWSVEESVNEGAGEGLVVVTWRETDGPKISEVTARRGFGTTLIGAALNGDGRYGADLRLEPTGAVCVIRLPLRRSAPAGLSPEDSDQPSPPGHPAAGVQPLAGRRILLVEDEPVMRLDLQAVLAHAGALPVGPAGSVDAAWPLARDQVIDAAVLDVNVNGTSINDLALHLHQQGVPLVFLTGYETLAPLDPALHDIPHLRKPVRDETVVTTLVSILSRRQVAS